MDKQQILESIVEQLPYLSEDILRSILNLIEHLEPELDDWDRQMIADAESGKLDEVIATVIAEDKAGKTIDLEKVCD